mmetsp:Transcript_20387/g.36484  ORF Transcript_20387/g.36484 Transcript_20387/m.36484 type:complete len:87 (-) Transcript_20387:29-289(-)
MKGCVGGGATFFEVLPQNCRVKVTVLNFPAVESQHPCSEFSICNRECMDNFCHPFQDRVDALQQLYTQGFSFAYVKSCGSLRLHSH